VFGLGIGWQSWSMLVCRSGICCGGGAVAAPRYAILRAMGGRARYLITSEITV
jgi:hypothetical protein